MKKITICFLAVLMIFSMVGCGNSAGTPEPAAPDGFALFREKLDAMQYTYTTAPLPTENTEAAQGEQYLFDFGSVSLYRFETGSAALTNSQFVVDGKVIPLLIKGNYGAVISVAKDASTFVTIMEILF